MAAGVIYQTVTTTTGETVELAFYVDNTVTPTTWIPVHVNGNTSGTPAAFGSGANGVTVPRFTVATDDTLIASLATKLDTVAADIVAATLPVGAGTATAAGRVTTASNDPARPRAFAVVGTTLTRPANTTAYAANDSISDNATAGSVTAQPVTLSDTNDDPIILERIRVVTSDTALAASKNIRIWVYGSDPTASTGVAAGDNVAYSNKKAGFLGTMSGAFRAGHSDGGIAICVPDEGSRIICAPGSGAKTVWLQYQALDAFTPSANSTTLIPTVEGVQARV